MCEEVLRIGEIEGMDVTTRKRGLATEVADESSGTAERGKVGDGETELTELCSSSSCLVQVKRCRQVTENCVDDQCWSPSSGDFAASYCSSTEVRNEDLKILDLEVCVCIIVCIIIHTRIYLHIHVVSDCEFEI